MNWKTFNCRKKLEHIHGVKQLLEFAFANAAKEEKIRCPCVNCYSYQYMKTIVLHLLNDGIIRSYNSWEFHREKSLLEELVDVSENDKHQDLTVPRSQEDVDETFSMIHDITNASAFHIVDEFERLGGPEISEFAEVGVDFMF